MSNITSLSYGLSFVFLGIYWNNHHHLLQAIQHADGRVPSMRRLTSGRIMGGFLGGLLLANLGGQGMYLVVGVIVLAIVALSWIGERLLAERPAAPRNV